MDLRKQKSRKKIIDAFLELRSKSELERVSVVSVCKLAGVNKSTFYVHFKDIYDLSEQLEKEVNESIIESIPNPECVIEDTKDFTMALMRAYVAKKELINILFSGSRSSRLPALVESSVKELVFSLKPEYRDDEKINISLSYRIFGGFYAYNNSKVYDTDVVMKVISEMSDTI